ncbi:MAG TPA: helix-turn-helix domain-containing protein [Candidatus Thermoplasmatota archaeon]|nr:helix-turn-helix domain-containing protein [Candidatus Thermoplasmatota archaeon]
MPTMQTARSPSQSPRGAQKPLCPTGELMDFLGRRHMMHILRMFGTRDTLRFNQIARELHSSPNTLSLRLNELAEAGVLARQVFAEVPPRVDYSLTEKGRALLEGVMAFDAYLKRYR